MTLIQQAVFAPRSTCLHGPGGVFLFPRFRAGCARRHGRGDRRARVRSNQLAFKPRLDHPDPQSETTMPRTVEAVIEPDGRVRLLEQVVVHEARRAVVTILDEAAEATDLPALV